MVFLEDVVHLRHVLAGHGLDDEPPVVGGEEARAAAALAVAVHRGAAGHRVLGDTQGVGTGSELPLQSAAGADPEEGLRNGWE